MSGPRRVCGCGCGEDISHRHPHARYVDGTHKQRRYDQEGGIRKPLVVDQNAPADDSLPPDIAITKARIAVEELAIKQIERESDDLDLRQRLGELVPLSEVEGEFIARAVAIRTKILACPARYKQRRPHLAVEDVTDLEDLLREVLEELASDEAAVDDDEDGESA